MKAETTRSYGVLSRRRWIVVILGTLASLAVVLAPRNNSMPAPVIAAVVGAVGVCLTDVLVWSGLARRWRQAVAPRAVTAVVVGASVGFCFTLTEGVAFGRAFGTDVPSEVKDIVVGGYYVRGIPGGASDLVIFLQFEASQDQLQKLLSHRSFERDAELERQWSDPYLGNKHVWRHLFGGMAEAYAGESWRQAPATDCVEIYRWGEGSPQTTVLCDVDSGRIYALFMLG